MHESILARRRKIKQFKRQLRDPLVIGFIVVFGLTILALLFLVFAK